jgi:hypothetical protein
MTDAPRSIVAVPERPPWYRRRLALIGAAPLVVAAVVAAALVLGSDRGVSGAVGDGAAAASTTAAETTAPGTTAPAPSPVTPADPNGEPVSADEPPPALPAARLDAPVVVEQVTAELSSIEEIDAEGRGRGSVSGPALRVTVRLTNGSGAPLSLDGVSVNLAFGADSAPASPVDDPSVDPFAGGLEPGGAASGVYVFRVPEGQRGSVTVQVGVGPATPLAIFAGAVD